MENNQNILDSLMDVRENLLIMLGETTKAIMEIRNLQAENQQLKVYCGELQMAMESMNKDEETDQEPAE